MRTKPPLAMPVSWTLMYQLPTCHSRARMIPVISASQISPRQPWRETLMTTLALQISLQHLRRSLLPQKQMRNRQASLTLLHHPHYHWMSQKRLTLKTWAWWALKHRQRQHHLWKRSRKPARMILARLALQTSLPHRYHHHLLTSLQHRTRLILVRLVLRTSLHRQFQHQRWKSPLNQARTDLARRASRTLTPHQDKLHLWTIP
mmetsp:Transcript_62174/g.161232  ORF Transcript_62174/g.161232 Transcript_62174/m.161232 type:complete len:204 (-) Transcript_62174:1215-1826(-)